MPAPDSRPPIPMPAPSQVRAKHLRPLEDVETKLRYLSLKPGRRRGATLLHELLMRRGIPASELAEAMRISPKDVHKMRNGRNAIAVEHILAMAEGGALRVALAYLDALRMAVLNDNDHP